MGRQQLRETSKLAVIGLRRDLSVGREADDYAPGLPTRPRMSIQDRAAQFAPFAALSGHGAAIRETARLTDQRIELEEDQLVVLNEQLQKIMDRVGEHPEVSVLYFKPDGKKDGGAYVTVTGKVKKIDEIERTIVFVDKTVIPIGDILDISYPDET